MESLMCKQKLIKEKRKVSKNILFTFQWKNNISQNLNVVKKITYLKANRGEEIKIQSVYQIPGSFIL